MVVDPHQLVEEVEFLPGRSGEAEVQLDDTEDWPEVHTPDPGDEVETEAEIAASFSASLSVDISLDEDKGAGEIPLMKVSRVRESVAEILRYIISAADGDIQPLYDHLGSPAPGSSRCSRRGMSPSRCSATSSL